MAPTQWSMAVLPLLAHQGGWDEILFVVGPILLIAGLLRLAKHRVTRGGSVDRPDAGRQSEHGDREEPPGT